MLLAIDIGNSNMVLGVYQGRELVTHWRLVTQPERTVDEYGALIGQLAAAQDIGIDAIDAIIVSCVVPPMVGMIDELGRKFFGVKPLLVGPGLKTGMPILYDSPQDVGADRIANGVAAYERFHAACVVIDFGTATTFDCVSDKGEYLGGLIAPGLMIAVEALFQRASKLPRVEVVCPSSVIGKSTVHSIQSGIYPRLRRPRGRHRPPHRAREPGQGAGGGHRRRGLAHRPRIRGHRGRGRILDVGRVTAYLREERGSAGAQAKVSMTHGMEPFGSQFKGRSIHGCD